MSDLLICPLIRAPPSARALTGNKSKRSDGSTALTSATGKGVGKGTISNR